MQTSNLKEFTRAYLSYIIIEAESILGKSEAKEIIERLNQDINLKRIRSSSEILEDVLEFEEFKNFCEDHNLILLNSFYN